MTRTILLAFAMETLSLDAAASEEVPVSHHIGIAHNAKDGAIVLVDDAPIYIEGLWEWPEHVLGATVRVNGQPTRRTRGPVAVAGEPEAAQGKPLGTEDDVVTSPTWTPLGFHPPWSFQLDGSSHHLTTASWTGHATTGTWSYQPVPAEMSSSGLPANAPPARGTFDTSQGFQLWRILHPLLEAGTEPSPGGRPKGTAVLTVTEHGRASHVQLDTATAAQLEQHLSTWRAAAASP